MSNHRCFIGNLAQFNKHGVIFSQLGLNRFLIDDAIIIIVNDRHYLFILNKSYAMHFVEIIVQLIVILQS